MWTKNVLLYHCDLNLEIQAWLQRFDIRSKSKHMLKTMDNKLNNCVRYCSKPRCYYSRLLEISPLHFRLSASFIRPNNEMYYCDVLSDQTIFYRKIRQIWQLSRTLAIDMIEKLWPTLTFSYMSTLTLTFEIWLWVKVTKNDTLKLESTFAKILMETDPH